MTREEILAALGAVLAGLQVPVSMGMPLGAATEPWTRLHRELTGVGWSDAESYTAALTERLS